MRQVSVLAAVSSVVVVAVLAACASQPAMPPGAEATLAPTKGHTASGTVVFTPIRGQVLVTASVSGLKPNSEHGFHIHEKGDCSAGDGMSAGGH
ncbi:MAG: superoxide dismutase family protein, partial [Burkholderiaceae bacterium]